MIGTQNNTGCYVFQSLEINKQEKEKLTIYKSTHYITFFFNTTSVGKEKPGFMLQLIYNLHI